MARPEPPPPGWYPDPEGGARLRWWHGTDWADRYRPPPSPSELQRAAKSQGATEARTVPAASGNDRRSALTRSDVDDIITQVRDVTRAEVDRATEQLAQRSRAAARELQPLISEYTNRVFRWLRIGLALVVVVFIAWFAFQAIAQVTLLEWLGDRIDALTD